MHSTSTRKSPNETVDTGILDCSEEDISYEALARLNEYFQLNRIPMPEFEYFKKGPDHIPMFTCQTVYNGYTIQATAATKKDAEKKVKSHIWYGFLANPSTSKGNKSFTAPTKTNISMSTIPNKMQSAGVSANISRIGVDTEQPSFISEKPQFADKSFENIKTRSASPSSSSINIDTRIADYKNFKDVMGHFGANKQNSQQKRPIVFLDLTSVEMTESEEKQLSGTPNVILFVPEERQPWKGSVVIVCKENDTVTTGVINRIIYYLIDNKSQEKILLISDREFKQLEKSLEKTGQKVIVKTSVKEATS